LVGKVRVEVLLYFAKGRSVKWISTFPTTDANGDTSDREGENRNGKIVQPGLELGKHRAIVNGA